MWVQDRVAKGELTIAKVKGENTAADGLMMHVGRHKMYEHMQACGAVQKTGRREFCSSLGDV